MKHSKALKVPKPLTAKFYQTYRFSRRSDTDPDVPLMVRRTRVKGVSVSDKGILFIEYHGGENESRSLIEIKPDGSRKYFRGEREVDEIDWWWQEIGENDESLTKEMRDDVEVCLDTTRALGLSEQF